LKVSGWENAAGPQASSRPLRRAARNGTVFITRELNRFRGQKQFTIATRGPAPGLHHARNRTANRPGWQSAKLHTAPGLHLGWRWLAPHIPHANEGHSVWSPGFSRSDAVSSWTS
jgi:hypothetical protein